MSDQPSRRGLLKGAGATLGAAAFARALAPITEWTDDLSMEGFLQKHYKELSRDDMHGVLRRLEQKTLEDYGAVVTIEDVRPIPDVQFGYALNLSACIGCRRCAEACHVENNHDRATNNSYIRVPPSTRGPWTWPSARRSTTGPFPSATSTTCPCSAISATTRRA